ncbi:MAG: amidohydrolase family protein, partial [Gemmatimonadota bacterium]
MNAPIRLVCAVCALCCALALGTSSHFASAQQQPQSADVILTGGRIFTADASAPWAEAIAIRGARIVAIGTNADIARLATPRTRRIELAGRTVVPGFEDAHDHVGLAGIGGTRVVMDPSPTPDPSLAAVIDSIVAATRRAQPATWISATVGAQVFDDPRATRALLDSIAPRHAVWLSGWSGHGAVLNTPALRGAGLFGAPDPPGGWQTRNAAGVTTGRIDEYALYGASRRLALLRQQDNGSALAAAFRRADDAGLRLGITTVQDMATGYDLAALRRTVKRGGGTRARHRVIPFPLTDTKGRRASEWRTTAADSAITSRMEVSGIKWILDGTPIERLALMRQPYTDRPGW